MKFGVAGEFEDRLQVFCLEEIVALFCSWYKCCERLVSLRVRVPRVTPGCWRRVIVQRSQYICSIYLKALADLC